ncbi:hypothetical protein [uncultured Nostoc sp.]|uniref:hypothetical protein n=1 Tax=uncultured Nostoc sp. TaxID=340711 RepID=UPI0035C9AC00
MLSPVFQTCLPREEILAGELSPELFAAKLRLVVEGKVYTLASSTDSFGEETTEIRETISATARQERIIKPSTDIEIYNIVKQRMFSSIEANAANNASKEYLQTYKASRINLPTILRPCLYFAEGMAVWVKPLDN